MKNTALLLFISIGLLISCNKDKTITKTENPAKATIDAKLVVDTLYKENSGDFEFGNKFYSSRNGSITKLGCKTASKGNFRISLWDFDTKNLITATTVNITDTTIFIYNPISPISIIANTRYVISINNSSQTYYVYFKKPTTSGPNIYPFTSGSITFEDFRQIAAATPTFPTSVTPEWLLAGVPDMQFEYTE